MSPSTASSRAAATRERLLAIGVELFGRRPYDELSIDEVAAAAGVSHGLLFHHFGSKRGFYLAALERVAAQLEALSEPDPALPVRERLAAGIAAHVDFVAERATGYRVLMTGGIGSDPQAQAIVSRVRGAAVERGLALLDDEATPRVREALHAWTGLFERALLRWLDDPVLTRGQLVELMTDTLFAVVAAAASRARA